MASTEELEAQILAEMQENPEAYAESANEVLVIDAETREIITPSDMLLGVLEDKDVERRYFKCPKIVGDNIDLSQHQIYIKYTQATDNSGKKFVADLPGIYHCDDVTDEGDYITFSWKLSGNVFIKEGFIAFSVLASDGEVTRWNTIPAIGTVLITIPGGLEEAAELYPDIITQLFNQMEQVKAIATPEAMQNYVEAYLAEHPVELDETLTDNTKAAPAGIVGELKSDIDDIKVVKKSFNLAENAEDGALTTGTLDGVKVFKGYNAMRGIIVPLGEHTAKQLTLTAEGNKIFRFAISEEKPAHNVPYRIFVSNDSISHYTVDLEETDRYIYFTFGSITSLTDAEAEVVRSSIRIFYGDRWETDDVTAGAWLRNVDEVTDRRTRTLFASAASKPILTMIDDDTLNIASVTKFHDLLSAYGVTGTYATLTAEIEKTANDGLRELLLEYEKEGFHCCLHGNLQQPYYTVGGRDMAAAQADFVTAKRKLHAYGFSDPDFFVTPYGVTDQDMQNMARRWGMHCSVSIGQKAYEGTLAENGRYALSRVAFGQTDGTLTTFDNVKEVMRTAAANNGWVLIGTHIHEWDDANGYDRFNEMVQYALNLGFTILPLNEAWRIREPIYRFYEMYQAN